MTDKTAFYVIKTHIGAYYISHGRKMYRELWKAKVFHTETDASKYLSRYYNSPSYSDAYKIIPIQISEIDLVKNPIYKIGDFVEFYEGMGEASFGTILEMNIGVGKMFKIQEWTHDENAFPSHVRSVTKTDMRGLSTPEKAMEYYLIRSENILHTIFSY